MASLRPIWKFGRRSRKATGTHNNHTSIQLDTTHGPDLDLFAVVKAGNLEQMKSLIGNSKLQVRSSNGMTLLHTAVASNSLPMIRLLLEDASIPINAQDDNGDTALHLAIRNGNIEATDALLEKGADDSIKNNSHDPPLHLILRKGNCREQLSSFLKYSINLHVNGAHGYNGLHVIAEQDNIEALETLQNANVSDTALCQLANLHIEDDHGNTPIHLAAINGSHRVLDLMISQAIESGVKPEEALQCLDEQSGTPLHAAVEHGFKPVVDVLLKYGASPTTVRADKLPPCHLACFQGKLDIIAAMVEACGAEILQSQDAYGDTPLHYSASSFSDDVLSFVIDQVCNPNSQNHRGNTPLHTAVIHGNAWKVELLLSKGSDPFIINKDGYNPFHLSLILRRLGIFEVLASSQFAHSLSVTPDTHGDFPVHLAVRHKFSQSVPTLMSLLNATHSVYSEKESTFRDQKGNNFLHAAAESGDISSLTYLVHLPCSRYMLNDLNAGGYSPLCLAAINGSAAGIELLTNSGATSHKAYCGNTPFMLACFHGHLEAAKVLSETFPFQKNSVNEDGDTALHLSARSKNVDVIITCLDLGEEVTLNNSNESFFDIVIDDLATKTAIAVLKHDRWEECLDVHSPDLPHPVLRMIEAIPEAFQVILDRSVTFSSLNSSHLDYWEEFNFKYLTLHTESEGSTSESVQSFVSTSKTKGFNPELVSSASAPVVKDADQNDDTIPTSFETRPRNSLTKGRNLLSVLGHLVKYRHKSYLVHPLIVTFLKLEWRKCGRLFYTLRLLCLLLLTIALSVFVSVTPPPMQLVTDSTAVNISSNSTADGGYGVTSDVFRFLTLFFTVPNLIYWLVELYMRGVNCVKYLVSESDFWMHGLTILFTFIFTIPWQGLHALYWEVGAIAIFFAWSTVIFFLQVFSISGILVSMFFSITRNVFRVLLLVFSVVCAFAFPLYILVGTVPTLGHPTVGVSLFSVLVSLHAEVNYASFIHYMSRLRYATLTFLFVSLLVIIMPIVVINLLIGLAVGDIARIQQEGILSQRGIKVRSLQRITKHLPNRLTDKIFQQTYKHYPNRRRRLAVKKIWNDLWGWHEFYDETNDANTSENRSIDNDFSKENRAKLIKLEGYLEKLVFEQKKQEESLKRIEDILTILVRKQEKIL